MSIPDPCRELVQMMATCYRLSPKTAERLLRQILEKLSACQGSSNDSDGKEETQTP